AEGALNAEQDRLLASSAAEVGAAVAGADVHGGGDAVEALATGVEVEQAPTAFDAQVDEVVANRTGHVHVDAPDGVDRALEHTQVERQRVFDPQLERVFDDTAHQREWVALAVARHLINGVDAIA